MNANVSVLELFQRANGIYHIILSSQCRQSSFNEDACGRHQVPSQHDLNPQ